MQATLPTYDESAVMEGQARYAGDKNLFVQFYRRAVMNNFKSAEAGRPIFDEQDFVRIIIPGDKNNVIDTKVTAEHKQRFEERYNKFLKNQEQSVTGTPLEMWPQMTVGMVAELKAMNVSTVEQLAEMSDVLASKFMGAHMWRQRAKLFLDAAAGEAGNSKLAAELEKRDAEIATLKTQMEQLIAAQQRSQGTKVEVPAFGKNKG